MIRIPRSTRLRAFTDAARRTRRLPSLAALLAVAVTLLIGAGRAAAGATDDNDTRRLETLAKTRSTTIDRDPASAARLRAHVVRFPLVGGRLAAIGPIPSRKGAAGTLHVIEYTRSGVAMPGANNRLLRAAPTMLAS
jgi:hypothetical protein